MANKIGIVLALDGEKEFSQGLKTASSAAKEAKSKLKELDTEYSGSANSIEALRAKQEALTEAQQKYNDKVKAAESGLNHANTTLEKCKTRYSELQKEVDEARKALQEMESAGKSGTSEYSEQADQVKKLEQALSDQGNECNKAQQKVSDYGAKLNSAQSELNQMNNAVEKNDKYLEEAKQSADGCATSIDQYGNEVQQATTVTTTWGDKLKQAFANAAVTAGMKVLREGIRELQQAFKEMIEVGSEFESSMSYVSAVSGATGADLDSLTSKAQELGSSTKFTASEVSDAFGYMALAGWDTEQMLDGISGVLDLAAASGMELADASDMVTDYLSAFNMEASEASTVADMLAFAQANSNTTAEQLGEAYHNCAANLNAAGQDIQTTTAFLEAMANQGQKGATAGTALNAVMRDITSKMKDGAIAIGDTSVAVEDEAGNFRDLTDIVKDVEKATQGMGDAEQQAALKSTFTSRSLSAMNLILNEGSDAISSYEDALRDCDGAASDMAETMQDNLQGDMTKLNSAMEGLGISIYNYFSGPLRSAVEGITDVVSNVTSAISPQQNIITEQAHAVNSLVDEVKSANDELIATAEATESVIGNEVASAERITTLGTALENLNGIEDKTVTQKDRMSEIVAELSGTVPELAAAFDEEAGKIDLSNDAMEKLVQSSADLQKLNVWTETLADEYTALANAELEYTKANNNLEMLQGEADLWTNLTETINDYQVFISTNLLQSEENAATAAEYMAEIQGMLDDAFQNGIISEQEYQSALDALSESVNENGEYTSESYINLGKLAAEYMGVYVPALGEAEQETAELKENLDAETESYEVAEQAVENFTTQVEREQAAADGAVLKSKIMSDTTEKYNETIGDATDETEAFVDQTAAVTGMIGLHTNALRGDVPEIKGFADAEEEATDASTYWQDETGDLCGTLGELEESTISATEAQIEIQDKFGNSLGTMGDYAAEIVEDTEATTALGEASKNAIGGLQELRASAEEVAAAMDTAYTDSFNSVMDLYNSTKESFASGLDIDFRTSFNGGADETVESMLQTSQENLDALQNYSDNLELVKDHVGEEIAPEFLAYLESLGTDGANTLEHIAKTFEQDNGSELIKQWSDNYLETMNIEDQIAATLALDQLFLENGLSTLGSTEAEWDGLEQSMQAAVDIAGENFEMVPREAQEAFQEAAQAAQAAGVEIPDGLAEGLEDGSISIQAATDILNTAMQGKFDSMVELAEENGIEIPEGLSEGVEEGGEAAADAINTLIEAMTESLANGSGDISEAADSAVEDGVDGAGEGAGDGIGSEIDESIADDIEANEGVISDAAEEATEQAANGVEEGTSAVTDAATSAIEQVQETVTDAADEFVSAGEEIGNAIAEGLENSASAMQEAIQGALQKVTDAADNIDVSGFEAVGEKAAEEFSGGMANGISGNSGDSLAQAVLDSLNARVQDFEAPGNEAWNAYLNGIDAGQGGATSSGDALAQAALDAANALVGSFEDPGSTSGQNYASGIASQYSAASVQARYIANGAISSLSDQAGSFMSPGSTSGQNYASGISSQQGAAASAASSCANAAVGAVQGFNGSFQLAGSNMMSGLATGINNGASQAINAAASAARSALAAAKAELQISSPSKKFENEVGLMASEGMAEGILDGKKEVQAASVEMAEATLKAAEDDLEIASPSKKFRKAVGKQIGSGVAFGIKDSEAETTAAAESYSKKVYNAATKWLKNWEKDNATTQKKTTKNEKYFWKQLEKICDEGTTGYNKAAAKLTVISVGNKKDYETVEDYYSAIYNAADDYLSKRETLNEWSLAEELSYWTAVQRELKKGTDAWYDAQEQLNKLASQQGQIDDDALSRAKDTLSHIEILNDTSTEEEIKYWETVLSSMTKYSDAWYEVTDTINSLKAEAEEDVEDSYAEIINAANDYVDKQTALDNMSEREQLAYWKEIQKQVKKGTDAWYDAQSKINSIQSNIGTVSNMSDLLDSYQTYTEVSAQAEMQYWDIVRKQYAEGTDERLEADKKYYDAKKNYTEKLESLEDEYLSKVQSVNDQLESDIKALTDAYDEAISSRTSTLKSAYSLFDEFTSESVTGQELLFNLEGQAAGYEAWSDAIDALAERGILSDELLEDLTDMGPEEIAAIYALSDLTDEDLKKYNDAYQRKMDAIQAQAEKENEDLLAETEAQTAALQEQADKDLAELKATYDADVASVNETISSELKLLADNTLLIADDETAQIVSAINSGMSSLETYFKNAEKAASSATSTAKSTASSAGSTTTESASSSSSDEISKILDIIFSGDVKTSLTAKQRENRNDLYVYLVDNYQRALTKNQQIKLGKQLGVDTSKSGWRKKALAALQKKGFAEGGTVDDDLVWMDEQLSDIGPELVISRSDNAILTRLPRGSEIVDANTSKNLLRLSKIDPDELLATMATQQATADEYLNQINTLGMLRLNNLLKANTTPTPIRISTDGMEERMSSIEDLIGECIELLTEGQNINLDGDKLVGGTAERMGTALAKRANRTR